MHSPARVVDAHRRWKAILADDERLESCAGRALVTRAMMMWLLAGATRDEVLAVAQRLFGDGRLVAEGAADPQALTYVIGALSWCDDFRGAEHALGLTFDDARRRGSMLTFADFRDGLPPAGAPAPLDGPIADAVFDGRAAMEVWRGGRQVYLHPSGYCVVCGLLEQDSPQEAQVALAIGERQPPATR
jgi:hypothetical protein